MPRQREIFISYRRGVASAHAGRLAESLERRFGKRVFIDFDAIAAGENFHSVLDQAIRASRVVLIVIHKGWAEHESSAGGRALDDPDDFVRQEIASALRHQVRVVPLLMEGAAMPRRDRLPPDIASLAERQALTVRDDDWSYSIRKLGDAIEPHLSKSLERPAVWGLAGVGVVLAVTLGAALLKNPVAQTGREPPAADSATGVALDPRYSSGEGYYVLTSSKDSELSWESEQHRAGYFTHFLVEAFRRSQEPPTLKQVFDFVSANVSQEVSRDKNSSQHPQLFPSAGPGDLRLGVIPRPGGEAGGSGVEQAGEFVGQKYALVVGISRFEDQRVPSIQFASTDARTFSKLLADPANGRFSPNNISLLTDGGATRGRILGAMQSLALQANPQDLVVFYFNSHGSPRDPSSGLQGMGYLVTHDTKLDQIWNQSLLFEDFFSRVAAIKAKRKVVFLDVAYSGQGGIYR